MVDYVRGDEAGAITLAELLIVWTGRTKLILTGDNNNQTGPIIMSLTQKFGNGRDMNAMRPQLAQSFFAALIENNWPHRLLPEQLRVELGLWSLANTLIYGGLISTSHY